MVTVFNLICTLLKASNFYHNSHSSVEKTVYTVAGFPSHFSNATVRLYFSGMSNNVLTSFYLRNFVMSSIKAEQDLVLYD